MWEILHVIVITATALSWLSAVAHSIALMRHRQAEISILTLMFQGYKFFDIDNFKPSGHAYHHRMILSIGGFVVFGALTAATAFLSGQLQS